MRRATTGFKPLKETAAPHRDRHRTSAAAMREVKFAAAEAVFEKYGVAPLSADTAKRVEAEWQGASPKKKRRRVERSRRE